MKPLRLFCCLVWWIGSAFAHSADVQDNTLQTGAKMNMETFKERDVSTAEEIVAAAKAALTGMPAGVVGENRRVE